MKRENFISSIKVKPEILIEGDDFLQVPDKYKEMVMKLVGSQIVNANDAVLVNLDRLIGKESKLPRKISIDFSIEVFNDPTPKKESKTNKESGRSQ